MRSEAALRAVGQCENNDPAEESGRANIEVGQIVGGKYELVRVLGRGSMGQVWVAHHRTLGENVALKLLAAPIGGAGELSSTSAARFRFEAQIAARLSRKTRHIVSVTDHGEQDDGLAYLVMELLEGETLERLLVLRGPMPPGDVVRIVAQIARALEEAHAESIVHRDLKPANVFVTRDEEGGLLIKLLDFGIARAIRTQRVTPKFTTGDGLIFGTAGYMSPEQACASKVDPRCDLWALATVAYEALTGDLPVTGTSTGQLLMNLHAGRLVPIHSRRPDLPTGLAAFFERAFARRIENRFVSASQLAVAFEHALGPVFGHPLTRVPLAVAVRDGESLPTLRVAKRRRFRETWRRVRFVGPVAILSLAMAGAGRPTTGRLTLAPGDEVPSASTLRAEESEAPAASALLLDRHLSRDPVDGPEGLASDGREPGPSAMTQKPKSPTLIAPHLETPQAPKPTALPRSTPFPTGPAPAKSVDRSAIL